MHLVASGKLHNDISATISVELGFSLSGTKKSSRSFQIASIKNRNYYEERILSFPFGVTLKLSKNAPIDLKK